MRNSQQLWKALNRLASVGAVLGALFVVSGCANRQVRSSDPAALYPAPHTVIAEPGESDDVEIVERHYVEEGTVTDSGAIGYHELSTGDRVEVVTYIHTYPDPIESFPRVYWGGAWYYNVHGDFVFYDPYYDSWVYYYGPPRPLVVCWNGYYPYAPYYWGVGYYGAGWYWGGVGVYGYHAYGIPVTNTHHHHHHHYDKPPPSSGGAASPGAPSGAQPSPGAPGSPIAEGPRRTKPSAAPTRSKPGANDAPTRSMPPQRAAAPTRTSKTVGMTDPFHTRAPAQRAPARAPSWGQTVTSKPTRTAPTRATPSFTPSRSTFGTSTRNTPSRAPSRATTPSRTTPSRTMPSHSPSRTTPSRTTPSRSPSRTTPSRSSPSRSPSRSSPSRAPSRSTPSRAPSRAPSRSSRSR